MSGLMQTRLPGSAHWSISASASRGIPRWRRRVAAGPAFRLMLICGVYSCEEWLTDYARAPATSSTA
jgi:hypothetical protein